MIRLAVVGTNWITAQFVDAALSTGLFELTAVYSRQLSRAEVFAEPYQASLYFDSLTALGECEQVDLVYIASPNAFHCAQAVALMQQGKHVIAEKPLGANALEVEHAYQTAKDCNVVLFEAFLTHHRPNFKQLEKHLSQLGALRKANFSYCQYSSRYQKYLDGENPNTFNPAFANGSVMDIGYYCVASAVALFGEPKAIQASAYLLDSGVDGHGSAILSYEGFDVNIAHSKVCDSYLASDIQGEEACLVISHPLSLCEKVELKQRVGEDLDISYPQASNPMVEEAQALAACIDINTMREEWVQRSIRTAKVLDEIRRQTGVVYASDKT
ncbi:Gfo/Idh/MocA family protein [Motilimonas pumila]|uniref:Gfo/Idh/MocA family oxidoreductase n=1 Tax=Motilimonas pumila TaxID=2303987 RepID=A0A418YKY6_9GAMM|nr:Gfo/Idh/MocA family oxidoreductase [Motilimonas pumila]RJG51480.1 gfo/Idh/MocA family oxidoreductase [Motilimonas pumila]